MSTISDKKPKKLTQAALAQHLFLPRGDRTIRELFDKKILPEDIDRQNMTVADLDRCREAYILHLRTAAAGRVEKDYDETEAPDDTDDPKIQQARYLREQRDFLKIKKAKLLGILVERNEVIVVVSTAFARVKGKMLKIPKALAVKLANLTDPAEVREVLHDEICEALDELGSTPVESIGSEGEDDGEIDLGISEADED